MSTPHAAVEVARSFVDAVVWGEHSKIWTLFSQVGRDRVLSAGSRGGLDAVMAQRIRGGTSSQHELDDFLSGLVRGLRVDLSAADLDDIEVAPEVEALSDGQVRAFLIVPAPFHSEAWPVGSLDLTWHKPTWLVDRLTPRLVQT